MIPTVSRSVVGNNANRAITMVLTSAENAAPARTWWSVRAFAPVRYSDVTERATNSSPMSAPAIVAQPLKKSWKLSGTTS